MPGPKPTPAESSIMIQPQDSLSIVLPVYNEAGTIERVLRDLHAKIAAKLADVEFIVAEDGSSDGTKEVLQRLAPELKLRLVTGRERKGYTRAVKDALALPRASGFSSPTPTASRRPRISGRSRPRPARPTTS